MNCSWCSQKGDGHTSRTKPGRAVFFPTLALGSTQREQAFLLFPRKYLFFSPPSSVSTLKLSISSPHPSAASVVLSRGFCFLTFWHSSSQQARKLDCKLHEVTNTYFLFGFNATKPRRNSKWEIKPAVHPTRFLPGAGCGEWGAGKVTGCSKTACLPFHAFLANLGSARLGKLKLPKPIGMTHHRQDHPGLPASWGHLMRRGAWPLTGTPAEQLLN